MIMHFMTTLMIGPLWHLSSHNLARPDNSVVCNSFEFAGHILDKLGIYGPVL